ncbi:MAG: hypothetical protein H6R19_2408 [Proteobacteria bacterium]|nr:hypothetical protein [Pseudomonadota bacterium]
MKHPLSLVVASLSLVLLSACSSEPSSESTYVPPAFPAVVKDGILVNNNGITLYTFDKDVMPNKSTCNVKCPFNWPPLFATPDDTAKGDYTIFERDDGMTQWAYKGKPLYQYLEDKKAGDKKGESKPDWKIAKP